MPVRFSLIPASLQISFLVSSSTVRKMTPSQSREAPSVAPFQNIVSRLSTAYKETVLALTKVELLITRYNILKSVNNPFLIRLTFFIYLFICLFVNYILLHILYYIVILFSYTILDGCFVAMHYGIAHNGCIAKTLFSSLVFCLVLSQLNQDI